MAITTDPLSALRSTDPHLAAMLDREAERQDSTLEFIASENHTSKAVMEATGSWLRTNTQRGTPGNGITGDVNSTIKSKTLLAIVPRNCLAANLRMFNLTAEQMQTLPLLWHCFNQATEF